MVDKEEMEKAEARKLQPYFIRAFFTEAFNTLGGEMRAREAGRYEIRHVPAALRERDRVIGETRTPVLKQYERICFEKQHVRLHGKPMADLIHPGHPLMLAITDLILSAHRSKLKQGSILVDPNDDSTSPKVLFMIDHSVRENLVQGSTLAKVVSRRLQFVEIDQFGNTINAGWAPHLDLQPINNDDLKLVSDVLAAPWISQNLEALALHHASEHLVPDHYQEVKVRLERQADKILSAVNERLVKEINYWSDRFIKLSDDVSTGSRYYTYDLSNRVGEIRYIYEVKPQRFCQRHEALFNKVEAFCRAKGMRFVVLSREEFGDQLLKNIEVLHQFHRQASSYLANLAEAVDGLSTKQGHVRQVLKSLEPMNHYLIAALLYGVLKVDLSSSSILSMDFHVVPAHGELSMLQVVSYA
ncbi:hypothetical protein [Pseudomonas fragi]|uniref:hypothetical protein n=1 Tax=Pseudomonas fragi TaxID=296 RepID=UPI0021D101E2|nr:hypothetical protein [Pseudomonas fragi]